MVEGQCVQNEKEGEEQLLSTWVQCLGDSPAQLLPPMTTDGDIDHRCSALMPSFSLLDFPSLGTAEEEGPSRLEPSSHRQDPVTMHHGLGLQPALEDCIFQSPLCEGTLSTECLLPCEDPGTSCVFGPTTGQQLQDLALPAAAAAGEAAVTGESDPGGVEEGDPVFFDPPSVFEPEACQFSDLLDSFSQFLQAEGEGGEVQQGEAQALPALASASGSLHCCGSISGVGGIKNQSDCNLSSFGCVQGEGAAPVSRSAHSPVVFSAVAHQGRQGVRPGYGSSSTASSSQCPKSGPMPLAGAWGVQPQEPCVGVVLPVRSGSTSSASSDSKGSSRKTASPVSGSHSGSGAVGGSTLLDKLRDLCTSKNVAAACTAPEAGQQTNASPQTGTVLGCRGEHPGVPVGRAPVAVVARDTLPMQQEASGGLHCVQSSGAAGLSGPGLVFSFGEPPPASGFEGVKGMKVDVHGGGAWNDGTGSHQQERGPGIDRQAGGDKEGEVENGVEDGGGEGKEGVDEDPEEKQRQQRLQRNRESALQSRQRRKQYVQELEQRCRMLEGQLAHMRQIVAMTALENGALRDEVVRLQLSHQQQVGQAGQVGQGQGQGSQGMAPKVGLPGSLQPKKATSPPVDWCLPVLTGLDGALQPEAASPDASEVQSLTGRGVLKSVGGEGVGKPLKQPRSGTGRVAIDGDGPGQSIGGGGSGKKQPIAVQLEAEPAALDSDSLPSESLLPKQSQHLCSFSRILTLFLLLLLGAAATALLASFLPSPCLCPHLWVPFPGPFPACPLHPYEAPTQLPPPPAAPNLVLLLLLLRVGVKPGAKGAGGEGLIAAAQAAGLGVSAAALRALQVGLRSRRPHLGALARQWLGLEVKSDIQTKRALKVLQ